MDDCGRTSATSRPSTMPSPPSTRPSDARGRRSSAFVRERHASLQLIAEYARTYHEERRRLESQADQTRTQITLRLGEIEREIQRAVDAIVRGIGDEEVLGERTKKLAAERRQLEAERAALPEQATVVTLHPAVLARYEQQLSSLQAELASGVRE